MILTRERKKMIRKAQDDFKVKGLSIVITGGAGVLCSRMVKRLVELGAHVAVLDLDFQSAKGLVNDVKVISVLLLLFRWTCLTKSLFRLQQNKL